MIFFLSQVNFPGLFVNFNIIGSKTAGFGFKRRRVLYSKQTTKGKLALLAFPALVL